MTIEGGATGRGGCTPSIVGAVACPGIETELSCLGTGLMRIGKPGVMRGMGLTGVGAGAIACGAPEIIRGVWGAIAGGALGRASGVWGVLAVGVLGLGGGTMEPMGGKEGNDSGEDNGGVDAPSVGNGDG